jgi:hypothetical protein
VASITMRAATRELLRRFALFSTASHTRSIPNRGPCLLVRRTGEGAPLPPKARLRAMQLRDRWEDVGRSVTQLVLGTFMVWDARRLRLCERYFETVGTAHSTAERGRPAGACPISARPRQGDKAG